MDKPSVTYKVSIEEPRTHLVEVTMSVAGAEEGGVVLRMPVWTPGSYLVREFSRHVQEVAARRVEGDPLRVEKFEKNAWRVHAKPGKRVEVSYRVYGNELTVRTNHIDADHAFLHPAATFLYVEGREAEPVTVEIFAPDDWHVATSLPLVGENRYRADDLDALMDAPFEVGPHSILSFEAAGVPHRIALVGAGNYDRDDLLADTQAICRTAAAMFGGDHPSRSYTFVYHILSGAAGGLEHKDSSICGFPPHSFRPARSYTRALSLISHEYFHLWNVKRIRPRELGPFDYGRETYTRLLWVAEGFTSYYQNIILRRADLMSVPVFLDELALQIRTLLEHPGRRLEPVAEASFDAWIKLYRPHENSRNVTISYYLKGALVALCLDMTIRDATAGEKSLDDVMRSLWSLHRVRPDVGFTEEELQDILAETAGRSLEAEIASWVHGTDELPLAELLAKFGLDLSPAKSAEPKAWLGITTKDDDGKTFVSAVLAGSPAFRAGLDAGDEILALDGWRIGKLADRLGDRAPGDAVSLLVSRRDRIREITAELDEAPPTDLQIRPREGVTENKLFEGWLGEPLPSAAEPPAPRAPDKTPRPI